MAKVKCIDGYPLWEVVDVVLEDMGDSYGRISRNLYVSKKGYLVKYWTREEGLVEQKFPTVDALRGAYDVPKMDGEYKCRC